MTIFGTAMSRQAKENVCDAQSIPVRLHCPFENCHKSYNSKKLRWPTSATAKLTFPRQNLLSHGKTYFSTAKLTFPRQNLLFHGKTYFSTAKLTFSRQNLLSQGKTYFSTAKLTFPSLASSLSLPMLAYNLKCV